MRTLPFHIANVSVLNCERSRFILRTFPFFLRLPAVILFNLIQDENNGHIQRYLLYLQVFLQDRINLSGESYGEIHCE
mgnify:CR=1 FL=1